ncbi:MAG: maleylpyruvate isomerase family mycothiol-dependent enzyme [Acidimicrobiia bacterium]|nr:maleylpyruvate isomerase family mycothiol-dependent enzyme [Acidimicrobiia bacterium]
MDFSEHVAAIRMEGAALSRAATAAGLDAGVPGCPDWQVADLVAHVGRLHRWVTSMVEESPSGGPELFGGIAVPAATELLDWFEHGVEPLAAALEGAGAEAEVWSWTDDRTAGFWARRQAHETALHRWDAESAVPTAGPAGGSGGEVHGPVSGSAAPFDADLAVDGIDEAFDMLPYRPGTSALSGTGETIHLHCTDAHGEWLLRLGVSGVEITREHAKGDVAARGRASDLLLLVYGRLPAAEVETFGDAGLLAKWQREARF